MWHVQRMRGQLDRRFFMSLAQGIIGFVLAAAVLITLFEKSWTFESIFDSFNWGIATVLGQGDSGYVTSPAGRLTRSPRSFGMMQNEQRLLQPSEIFRYA